MQEFDAINESIKQSKKIIEKADAIVRLKSNADFKLVIQDDYLKKYAAGLVYSKARIYNQDDKQQKALDGQILGVGHFVQYLDMVLTAGVTAQTALEDQEYERTAMLQEGKI